ncbi:hypothetical protein I8J29_15510 [Paenibacillus sp. MWE-103]|uniref:Copper amine oxidase-like N-terminal domain-containing protein n=1 Tax=Paenibacillus artemisiicola TaxID=1172618 RepID=A0ABS3WBF3_9BACL|nr:hypothetical protein [Paenibacillus artemisiicola]MBO7745617.1 hypothetical protein [Paenibacillus artemisiicola]
MANRYPKLLSAALAAAALTGAVAAAPASAAQPAQAPAAGTAFSQIIAGNYYSAALRADGTVWSWGRNLYGEIGVLAQNAVTSIAAPVRLPNLSGIAAIATNGSGMNVARKADGTVWEWGSVPGLKPTPRSSTLPAQVQGLANVTAVTAVEAGTGIALTGDARLLTWSHAGADGKAAVTAVPGTYKWTNLIACGDLAFALDASGGVWGLGVRRDANGVTTLAQPFKLAGLPAMKQLSAQANYGRLYGVDRSGGAWTWKLDLSAFHREGKPGAARVDGKPARLYPQLKAKEVQAGGYGLLLIENGEVWTIGKGPNGQEGRIKGLSGIVSIASGGYHDLALDAKGRVWGWGADNWNETGSVRPSGDGMLYAPTPVQPAIDVYVNGKRLLSPFPARIDGGNVSVPMRDVLQALGGSFAVAPDYATTLTYGGSTAVLTQGGGIVDGKPVVLAPVRRSFSGVSMIPAGLLRQLGVQAAWDGKRGELRLAGR